VFDLEERFTLAACTKTLVYIKEAVQAGRVEMVRGDGVGWGMLSFRHTCGVCS
jgi:hypothetical protein